MEFLCIFIPAMIFCLVRRNILGLKNEEKNSVLNLILEYAIACVGINLLFQLFIILTYPKVIDISKYLNHDIVFAVKYLLSGSIVAVIIPCIEKYIRNNFELEISFQKYTFNFQENFNKIYTFLDRIEEFLSKQKIQKVFYIFSVLIVLFVCAINVLRIFDNALWLDETHTVGASCMSFFSLTKFAISSGHSPLYYIFAWLGNNILDFQQDYHNFYVYHIFSLIPWMITILIGLSVVRKWFGTITSTIFSVCATLLYSSIYIALEVRMYSLCQLFILLTFLAAYKCYQNKKIISIIFFSIFSVLAIYSHYFAIPPIGGIYLIMLGYFYLKDNKYIKNVILSGVFIIASLIPWFWLSAHRHKGIISNYGLKETADIITCLNYIFSSEFSLILFIAFIIAVFVSINYCFGFINVTQSNLKKKIKINFNKINLSNSIVVWELSGLLSVFGMIIAAIIFSHLYFPIITKGTLRYFLPGIVILWLLFGIYIQKLNKKNLVSLIVILLIIFSGLPRLMDIYHKEMNENILHIQTLEAVSKQVNSKEFVITDQKHFIWGFLSEYYLGIDKKRVIFIDKQENLIPKINDKYLLILKKPIEDKFRKEIYKKGYKLNIIKEHGLIGNLSSNIYQLEKTKNYKGDQK